MLRAFGGVGGLGILHPQEPSDHYSTFFLRRVLRGRLGFGLLEMSFLIHNGRLFYSL
jgi:hypothetical protein